MPFKNLRDLPKAVKDTLPHHAEEIFLAAFNSAWDQYDRPEERRDGDDRETVAFKVAWAAVKKAGYAKDEASGEWRKQAA